ncbi:hypothetical protein, partial [Alicyclobacillus fodiniaquatilis]
TDTQSVNHILSRPSGELYPLVLSNGVYTKLLTDPNISPPSEIRSRWSNPKFGSISTLNANFEPNVSWAEMKFSVSAATLYRVMF